MQAGKDKTGIRHYLELHILLAEGIPPAGGTPHEQARHHAGVRDLGCSVQFGGAHLAATRTGGGWQDEAGQGMKESGPADLFHDITSFPQCPQGNDNTSLFYTKFREY